MYAKTDSIAKKYAIAYLNLYSNEITDEMIDNLLKLKLFLYKNKRFYAILSIPKLSIKEKLKFIDHICKIFTLSKSKVQLMHLLIVQKRIYLLDVILKKIAEEYNVRKGIIPLKIYTSHKIDDAQKCIITNFVKNLIKKNIKISFYINENLINGIRIKGNNLLWEHSVKKHLNFFKTNLYQQAIL